MLHYQGIYTWYTYFQNRSNIENIEISKSDFNRYKPHTLTYLNSKFSNFYKKMWADTRHKLIMENGKLRTFLKFKYSFKREKYLNFNQDFKKRKKTILSSE